MAGKASKKLEPDEVRERVERVKHLLKLVLDGDFDDGRVVAGMRKIYTDPAPHTVLGWQKRLEEAVAELEMIEQSPVAPEKLTG